jgi:hypothetical protein
MVVSCNRFAVWPRGRKDDLSSISWTQRAWAVVDALLSSVPSPCHNGPHNSTITVQSFMCELKYCGLVTVCGLSLDDFIFFEALRLFPTTTGTRSDTVQHCGSPVQSCSCYLRYDGRWTIIWKVQIITNKKRAQNVQTYRTLHQVP